MNSNAPGDVVSTGKQFWGSGSGGRWATEMFLKALKSGKGLTTEALRTLDTLQRDEWKFFDEILLEEAAIRLKAVGDLMSRGLTRSVPNGLGRTVYEYETITDMFPSQLSLDAVTRTENDRVEFNPVGLPLPIQHKDFWINIRTLMASRNRGEALDTTQVRVAGRLVLEGTENLLVNGTSKLFGGLPIYGYTTHPDRVESNFGTGGAWTGAKTGAQILADALTMLSGLHGQRAYGPYAIYVPPQAGVKLSDDFKADGDLTIRQRLMQLENVVSIQTLDVLAENQVLMVQLTPETALMVEGEPLQTIQWDAEGGMLLNFKVMTIQIPLIRADGTGRSGVYHMHT